MLRTQNVNPDFDNLFSRCKELPRKFANPCVIETLSLRRFQLYMNFTKKVAINMLSRYNLGEGYTGGQQKTANIRSPA